MADMALAARPRKTLDDYLALPEDVHAELIDGHLFVTPSPGGAHQALLLDLATLLWPAIRDLGLGTLWIAPRDVHLPTGDVVQPDLLFVTTARLDIAREDAVHGAPDLVVEIVSPSGSVRDRIVKRDLYARSGVREFWLVDLEARGLEVLRLVDGAWQAAGWHTGTSVVTSPLLPGLEVPLEGLFGSA